MYISLVRAAVLLIVLISVKGVIEGPQTPAEAAVKVSVCELKNDPAKYNRKLVEVTGFVSHGFEDFGLFDPTCAEWPQTWLDYGGAKESNTMYCCGVTSGQVRPKQISVEGISIPLIDDDQFKAFDQVIRTGGDTLVRATIVGRYFAGRQTKYPNGTVWGGYGHMGCCTLLMIQQVLSIDPRNRDDLDYRASPDQPSMKNVSCIKDLGDDWRFSEALKSQQAAESGDRAWAMDDPQRVAIERVAKELKINPDEVKNLTIAGKHPGRFVYMWKPTNRRSSYMVVVSRPYVLSFYARDPKKISWVSIAAYQIGCPK